MPASLTEEMLFEHTEPFRDWWQKRVEIVGEEIGEKARRFDVKELLGSGCNFDRCKFPKDDDEILPPDELIADFKRCNDELNAKIEGLLVQIEGKLG